MLRLQGLIFCVQGGSAYALAISVTQKGMTLPELLIVHW